MSDRNNKANKVNGNNDVKSSIANKVNSESSDYHNHEKPTKLNKEDNSYKKDNDTVSSKKSSANKDKKNNNKKDNKKQSNFFFYKLSLVGKISLVIILIITVVLTGLLVERLIRQGSINEGSRQRPLKEITTQQVESVKNELSKEVDADNITVTYQGFRFVVVMDLKDNTDEKDGKQANIKAYNLINKMLPVKDYFSSTDKLNNDLFIYSTDVVPTNYETNSKYIYESYKNSRMTKPASYNLLKYRDKDSYKEVLESIEKAKKDGN